MHFKLVITEPVSLCYTYFKKGCRRERQLAIAERRLDGRKELWGFNIDGK